MDAGRPSSGEVHPSPCRAGTDSLKNPLKRLRNITSERTNPSSVLIDDTHGVFDANHTPWENNILPISQAVLEYHAVRQDGLTSHGKVKVPRCPSG